MVLYTLSITIKTLDSIFAPINVSTVEASQWVKNAVRFSLVTELVWKICTLDKGVMSTGVAQIEVKPPKEQVPLMVMMEEQRRENDKQHLCQPMVML